MGNVCVYIFIIYYIIYIYTHIYIDIYIRGIFIGIFMLIYLRVIKPGFCLKSSQFDEFPIYLVSSGISPASHV